MVDLTDRWRIAAIIRKHPDFITYPIILKSEPGENLNDTTTEEKPINSMKPLWKRSASEVKPQEYAEFYRHIK